MFFYIHDTTLQKTKKIKTVNYIFREHNSELSGRLNFLIFYFIVVLIYIGLNSKELTKILQAAASPTVKFFQSSPNDYLFSSIKLSFYAGLLITFPILILEMIIFFLPAFSLQEKKISLPLSILSLALFISSIFVSFSVLLPLTFLFFLNYNEDILEPFWSFAEYFDFTLTVILGTGIMFQLPIIQFLLATLKLITTDKMIASWKIVVITSTLFGAIITPSTDPFSQLLLSSIIILLYFFGIILIKIYDKIIKT